MNVRLTTLIFSAYFLITAPTWSQTIRQRSTTEGFSIGLQGHSMGWSSDYFQFLDENSGNGAGIGGRVAYGFTQRLEAFALYDWTSLKSEPIAANSFQFTHTTLGARFNFSATTHALRPFAEVGYVYQQGKADGILDNNGLRNNLLFKGGALHLGGGLNYFVALPIAITLNGSLQTGAKSPVSINGLDTGDKADVSTFRISAGVILYLSELF